MASAAEQSDEFMELLTDALRAGPGSPEWHRAVGEVRNRGGDAADEYALLWTAREHLASGRGYREVRPGPGFTRKVMGAIESEPVAPKKPPKSASAATLIALLSTGVLVAVVGTVGYWMYKAGPPPAQTATSEELSRMVFVTPVVSTTFDEGVPAEWQAIGSLPVLAADGVLKPGDAKDSASAGGGIVTRTGLPATVPFAAEVTFDGGQLGDGFIPEVFVTDRPEYSGDRGMTPHELAWLVQDGQSQVVLPDGKVVGDRQPAATLKMPVTIRVVVGKTSAVVEANGTQVWGGPHGLAGDRPRYVGVRYLKRGGGVGDIWGVKAVKVKSAVDSR